MNTRFRRAAVLGAGVMGSGIAALLAGAGLDVLLLDIVPKGADDRQKRNVLAAGAIDRLKKSRPALLFHPRDVERIRVGNLEDDLGEAATRDLVIEVVPENLDIKRDLFARIEPLLGPRTVLTSNTSGLPIAQMMAGRSDDLKRRFLVTHFFNPVRYMRLLELVAGEHTDPALLAEIAQFGAEDLGKGIVYGHDTVNFVANRIGIHGMLTLINLAVERGYTVEEVDAIFGSPLGRPKSAVFRTADVVGLDTVIHVAENCYQNLPHDEARDVFATPKVLAELVARGAKGEKSGAGFYKKTPEGILALDLRTGEYRLQGKVRFPSLGAAKNANTVIERIKAVLAGSDRASELAWAATLPALAYASHRIGPRAAGAVNAADPVIADDLVNIDRGMRWGYGWDLGPFELWDTLGVAETVNRMTGAGVKPAPWVEDMLASGRTSFYAGPAHARTYFDLGNTKDAAGARVTESPRTLTVLMAKSQRPVVAKNDGATLCDLGDGVAGLELHTKMNSVDTDVITMIFKALEHAQRDFVGMVVGNDATEAFSAGANLMLVVMAAMQGDWKSLEKTINDFQQANQLLRYSPIPVVTAPFGLTLGGGCEIAMHGAAARAHAELYMGLVEVGVGLVPAAGGCKETLARALGGLPDEVDPFPLVRKLFEQIGFAKISMSAEEARSLGYLRESDTISFNRDFLIHDAKQVALGLARAGYRPPRPRTFRLPGASGFATLRSGLQMLLAAHQILPHDLTVGTELARVLTGGDCSSTVRVTEQYVLDLEREAFLKLCGEEKTRERMTYMLQNNKPLRN